MAGDYLQRRYIPPKHLSSAVCAVFVIDSVKTVAANASALVPDVRHWIDESFRRQGAVKAGIEYRNLRDIGQQLFDQLDPLQSRLIVQGRNCRDLFNCLLHLRSDERGFDELGTSMNDAVSGNVDFTR